jgi:hypothetical protein
MDSKLLNEWAEDFEEAANLMPTRLQGTILMTRALECREAAKAQGGEWLIQMRGEYLKTRGVWERPDHRGYTNDINEAGRYSEDEAKEAERMMPEKCKAVRLPTARAQGACEWAEQLDACEFHGNDHEVCAEYSGQVPCARAQSGQGVEPEGEERLTDVYRRQLFECQDELNNLRSEYHNRTAELETDIEDLQEELQRVRRQHAQQVSVPESIIEVVTDMLEDYARALDLGDLDGAGHSTTSCIYEVIDELAATPQPEGDAVAVPVAALEYLKDQWSGAYAKLYERICSNNLPQPQKEDA